jgi:hypothetical protein
MHLVAWGEVGRHREQCIGSRAIEGMKRAEHERTTFTT